MNGLPLHLTPLREEYPAPQEPGEEGLHLEAIRVLLFMARAFGVSKNADRVGGGDARRGRGFPFPVTGWVFRIAEPARARELMCGSFPTGNG